ncbi:hypothetical protein FB45DRAFT_1018813 [Roridomyces roridus]|uniref:SMP-30/Gluconolactonase/LRE-like region domain-containing protein n=1 Tax=Roridomyces roridus TaxID=1738132 RepID=A0AAD7CDV9_9AGAR|nr:hypothetical protein FB45DRAFT_1018813 [Roridomyces roridus]
MILLILSAIFAAAAAVTLPARVIYQDANGLVFENIAVRPPTRTLTPIYIFPNCSSLLGITEYLPDVYAVVAGDIDFSTFHNAPNSVSIWHIDLTHGVAMANQVVRIPETIGFNGLSSVPGFPNLVLAADSVAGAVYEVDMRHGTARIAITDESMSLVPDGPFPALGINGLRVHDGWLYYSNSQRGTFMRMPVNVGNGGVEQAGSAHIIATVEPWGPSTGHEWDDFTIDGMGRVWVATDPGAVTLLSGESCGNGTWVQEIVVGDAEGGFTGLTHPTSLKIGRGNAEEEHKVYAVTAGGAVITVDMGEHKS